MVGPYAYFLSRVKIYSYVLKWENASCVGLWGLVNNAGIGEVLPFELIDVARYRRLAETNLLGTIDVTMTFLPLVKKARGRIVNISSYSGRIVLPVVVSYAMSKFGIEAFTDGLR